MSTVKAINLQHPTATNTNVTMTSTERVGIGTSTPGFKTEVVCGYNDGIHIKDTSGTVYGGMFTESGTMALVTRSSHGLRFGTSDTTRMYIDSSGRVTKPYQPMFAAYNRGSATQTVNTNAWGSFNTNITNWATPRWNSSVDIGSNFNVSNGVFTAPIAGYYWFTVGMTADFKNSSYLGFYKNGATNPPYTIIYEYNAASGGNNYYNSTNLSYVFYMAAGDTMTGACYFASNSWTTYVFYDGYVYFAGHLIG